LTFLLASFLLVGCAGCFSPKDAENILTRGGGYLRAVFRDDPPELNSASSPSEEPNLFLPFLLSEFRHPRTNFFPVVVRVPLLSSLLPPFFPSSSASFAQDGGYYFESLPSDSGKHILPPPLTPTSPCALRAAFRGRFPEVFPSPALSEAGLSPIRVLIVKLTLLDPSLFLLGISRNSAPSLVLIPANQEFFFSQYSPIEAPHAFNLEIFNILSSRPFPFQFLQLAVTFSTREHSSPFPRSFFRTADVRLLPLDELPSLSKENVFSRLMTLSASPLPAVI